MRAGRACAESVRRAINATVSAAPIKFVRVTGKTPFEGFVAHSPRNVPEPMLLTNGEFMYVYQRLAAYDDELVVFDYRYTYQRTADRTPGSSGTSACPIHLPRTPIRPHTSMSTPLPSRTATTSRSQDYTCRPAS
jgi:hypothetical protein